VSKRNKIVLQPAYILHHRPYRDTSLLLEVFSHEYGRVGLVARGARSSRSRNKALFQPFQPLLISWLERGDLGTLTDIEAASTGFIISGKRVLSGFYINELILKLLHRHDPHSELFEHYAATIEDLFSDGDEQLTLRLFEKKLLQQLGYALLLDVEENTGLQVKEESEYEYIPETGPRVYQAGVLSGVKVSGECLLSLHNEVFETPRSQLEAKRLMRFVLAHHVGVSAMKTRAVCRDMNNHLNVDSV